jgi:hypothetical protein
VLASVFKCLSTPNEKEKPLIVNVDAAWGLNRMFSVLLITQKTRRESAGQEIGRLIVMLADQSFAKAAGHKS